MTRSKVNTQVDNGLDETNKSRQVDVTSSPGYRVESLIKQTLITGSEGNNQFNEELNTINVNVVASQGNWMKKQHQIEVSV